MDYVTLYNWEGRPIAWVSDNHNHPFIFLFDGTPAAYISNTGIYNYSGDYLGWFQDGWVRDQSGDAVFFTAEAIGGPAKPAYQARPARELVTTCPALVAKEPRPVLAARTVLWSLSSDESFFAP